MMGEDKHMLTAAYSIFIITSIARGIHGAYEYWVADRNMCIRRAVQREISNAVLPTADLQLTEGEETPDGELNDEQLGLKRVANRWGFKVEKIPFTTRR